MISQSIQSNRFPCFTTADQYQVGDLVFTGSDTVRTNSICYLDKLIITFQRIHSKLFNGKFYSKEARNTHVGIVVEVDKVANKVYLAEAVPTKGHKNDLRHVDILHHNYYELSPDSIETFEVLRPNQDKQDVVKYAQEAAESARQASKRIEIRPKSKGKTPKGPHTKGKHRFSHIKGLFALLVKKQKAKDLTKKEFDLTRKQDFFCASFVSKMLRRGEFITRQADAFEGSNFTVASAETTFNFDPNTTSPQKLRRYLEENELYAQVGVVKAPAQ